ncbi:hypothetical protein D1825_09330 [Cellulomonas rhizosphaerae]|uniref:Uncharacterized protein n=1 Tax=Cellulomonas rhizosphaerae TaxID=2293719 RepID=A0A413RLQ1_9CELL|nr:hypothetical protein D1825_09330 [Cellulomonas rhizosphaerae]
MLAAVAAASAWALAWSAHWSWSLAVRHALPADLSVLTHLRGPLGAVRAVAALVGAVLTVWLVARLASRGWAVVACLVSAFVALCALSGPPWYGPRATFEVMRADLVEAAAQRVDQVDADSYLGTRLPAHLAALSESGTTLTRDGTVFFPQWFGIPDDAGGYFYTASGEPPTGWDMFGEPCTEPLPLEPHWWACGMNPLPAASW